MKNKKVIFSIILVILLGFVSLFFLSREEKLQVKENSNKTKVNTESSLLKTNFKERVDEENIIIPKLETEKTCAALFEQEKEDCLNKLRLNESFYAKSPVLCLDISDYDERNICIYNRVGDYHSIFQCKRIASHSLVESCINNASIYTKYIGFCDEFNGEPHEKEECIDRTNSFIFADQRNIDACSEIKTLEYKNLCFVNNKNNCDDISDEADKILCHSMRLYEMSSSEKVCYDIESETIRQVCLNKFIDENLNKKTADIDSDGDGLSDEKEIWVMTDPFNKDTDNDGLTDYEELIEKRGGSPVDADTDDDGLSDYDEIMNGTSAQKADTDGDGVSDGQDINSFAGDIDKDGLTDEKEILWGTDPRNPDTDGDGKNDNNEIKNGTNPLDNGWHHDTDGDGLLDIDEIFYLTDPLKNDTDGDGVSDSDEILAKTNPLGSGDNDFDNDGLSDKQEIKIGTNPYLIDTNMDGLNDYDAVQKGIDAVSNDTDNDGLSNYFELSNNYDPLNSDIDGDGINDGDEIHKYKTNPFNNDTDGDGYTDKQEIDSGHDPRKK